MSSQMQKTVWSDLTSQWECEGGTFEEEKSKASEIQERKRIDFGSKKAKIDVCEIYLHFLVVNYEELNATPLKCSSTLFQVLSLELYGTKSPDDIKKCKTYHNFQVKKYGSVKAVIEETQSKINRIKQKLSARALAHRLHIAENRSEKQSDSDSKNSEDSPKKLHRNEP